MRGWHLITFLYKRMMLCNVYLYQAVAAAYQVVDEEGMIDSMMSVQLPQEVGVGDKGDYVQLPPDVLSDDGTQELEVLHSVQPKRGWILSQVCGHTVLNEWSNK